MILFCVGSFFLFWKNVVMKFYIKFRMFFVILLKFSFRVVKKERWFVMWCFRIVCVMCFFLRWFVGSIFRDVIIIFVGEN